MLDAILSNHRRAPDVASQPFVKIRRWQVVRTAIGEEMLVGVLDNGFTWRVTTAIVNFSASDRRVTTRSGRLYELDGAPAVENLDLLVIAAHRMLNSLVHAEDTSEIYWRAVANSTHQISAHRCECAVRQECDP